MVTPTPAAYPLAMARILVADDESAIRDVIESTCKLDAHEVRSFADSQEAIAAYTGFAPDLMILDVNMPGGGAEAILQRVEELTGAPPCPAIVVSGFSADPLDHPRVVEVIQKPFGIDALRIAVKTALGGS